ncbi:molybdopterin molybdenumtransferase MoeA, partial [filamentous cyanobacterium LEGE 11480]|nr:molybdopterin molybdenumtransferase MoeA [Romeriopsis navalis LEGE 11480]
KYLHATTAHPLKAGGKRETYIWGKIQLTQGQYQFQPASGSKLSGNLINLAGTNALAIVPIGQTEIALGDPIQVLTL